MTITQMLAFMQQVLRIAAIILYDHHQITDSANIQNTFVFGGLGRHGDAVGIYYQDDTNPLMPYNELGSPYLN